jgi:hypothetical protein
MPEEILHSGKSMSKYEGDILMEFENKVFKLTIILNLSDCANNFDQYASMR